MRIGLKPQLVDMSMPNCKRFRADSFIGCSQMKCGRGVGVLSGIIKQHQTYTAKFAYPIRTHSTIEYQQPFYIKHLRRNKSK